MARRELLARDGAVAPPPSARESPADTDPPTFNAPKLVVCIKPAMLPDVPQAHPSPAHPRGSAGAGLGRKQLRALQAKLRNKNEGWLFCF